MKRGSLNTARVIEVAASIADSDGLDGVTLTRVAAVLGVRQPALYRHIDGYDALIRSLGLMGRQILAQRLTEAISGLSGEAAVAAAGHAWRKLVRDHPGLYEATDAYPCAADSELEGAVENVLAILGEALEAFELDEPQGVHAARTLRSAFHGFSHLEAGDGHPLPHDPDDTFTHLVELLCSGIRSLEKTRAQPSQVSTAAEKDAW